MEILGWIVVGWVVLRFWKFFFGVMCYLIFFGLIAWMLL